MMLVDIVNPGWVPIYRSNLTEDIPGYIEAPANALAYSWKHFIGGHMGRLGTRDDLDAAPAVHGGHRRQLPEGDRHRRPDALLREVRRELLGGAEGLPRRDAPRRRPRP